MFSLGIVPGFLFGYHTPPARLDLLPPIFTLITAQFLHGGWLHLLGNLLYLWVFAPAVEDALGHLRFTVLFLITGIASGFV